MTKPVPFCIAAALLAFAAAAPDADAQSTSPRHGAHAATTSHTGATHAARPTSPAASMFALAPTPSAVRADTTITIRSVGAELEFLPSTIALRQGTRVTVRYVNQGTFPHNIVVVKTENDIDVLGLAAFQAANTGYVPMDHKDRMIAYSALAAPGETVEFTFVVPPAGEYPFACLYPGHYNMMVGTLKSLR